MKPPTWKRELLRLIAATRDDIPSDDQRIRLQTLVIENPEACRLYVRMVHLAAGLQWSHAAPSANRPGLPVAISQLSLATVPAPPPAAASPKTVAPPDSTGLFGRLSRRVLRPIVWSTFVSGTLFTCYAAFLIWNVLDARSRVHERAGGRGLVTGGEQVAEKAGAGEAGGRLPEAGGEQVATVIGSDDARWLTERTAPSNQQSQISNQKSELHSGEPLAIAAGSVQLKLRRGASLAIEGPARWSIVNDNRIKLLAGKLLALVPERAVGFTVETPTSEIVDLGTEFGVSVDDAGHTKVCVRRGAVEAVALRADASPLRLVAGQAALVSPTSLVPKAIPFDPAIGGAVQWHAEDQRELQPPSFLPMLPELTGPTLLFADNFRVLQARPALNPSANDAADRQSGALAPLSYFVSLGDLSASARMGAPGTSGRLLLVSDPQQTRTCFGPARNFVPPDRRGGKFSVAFSLQPAHKIDDPAALSSLWFGVHLGAYQPLASMQGQASRVGFTLQGTGGFKVFEQHRQLAEGNLQETLSAIELRKPLMVEISLDTPAFDGYAPALVGIRIDGNTIFQQSTQGGLFNNYLVFEYLHGRPDVGYVLADLKVQFNPLEKR